MASSAPLTVVLTTGSAAAREHVRAKLDPATNTAGQLAIWRRLATPAREPAPRAEKEIA